MDIELENDFCHNYSAESRLEVYPKSVDGLFSIPLTNNNVLLWNDFSFLLIESVSSNLNPLKKIIHMDDITLDQQIVEFIKTFPEKLCQSHIDDDYITDSIKEAEYKFIAAKSNLQYHGQQCDVVAFRFLKELNTEYYFLYNFKIVQSILVCATRLSKEVRKENAQEIIYSNVHPSFGSYLTYKSVQFAREKNFQYYYMRAVDLKLIPIYQEWGFHFGMPLLNLDPLINEFTREIESGKYTIPEGEARVESIEKILLEVVKDEIRYQLKNNYRFASVVLNLTREQFVSTSSSLEKDVEEIATFLVKIGNSFAMYLDLYSDDVNVLKNYSQKRIKKFF